MGWFKKWKPEIERAITSTDLNKVLRKIAPGITIFYLDRDYFIPASPEDVMSHIFSWRYPYRKASRDCDDFVRIFRGRLSEKGFGNLLAMDCIIDYYSKSKEKTVRHAVVAFLSGDKLVFGEPQTGKMTEYKDAKVIRLMV